jgi:hypothetical protein
MNHENKLQVINSVRASTHKDEVKMPWLIVCQIIAAHEWQDVVAELNDYLDGQLVSYRGMQQLELWLDSKPEPHIIIVDEYDPGLRSILQSLFVKMVEGKHRLFMGRLVDPDPAPSKSRSETQSIKETLDFMTR